MIADNEIRIGDEVIYHKKPYVVVSRYKDEVFHIIDHDWMRVVVGDKNLLTKTGRHFDEVV